MKEGRVGAVAPRKPSLRRRDWRGPRPGGRRGPQHCRRRTRRRRACRCRIGGCHARNRGQNQRDRGRHRRAHVLPLVDGLSSRSTIASGTRHAVSGSLPLNAGRPGWPGPSAGGVEDVVQRTSPHVDSSRSLIVRELGDGSGQIDGMDQSSFRGRLRAGDPTSFGELFDQYAGSVFRHAVRITGDAQHSDDVVSLTFLEAWRLRERLDPEGGSALPWLLGIATNVLRNAARARRRHLNALARLPATEPVPDFSDDVIDRLSDAEQVAAARAAFAALPTAEQDVVALCVWSEVSYADAASALGIPLGTVRSRLSRARVRLRTLMRSETSGRRPQMTREPSPGRGQVLNSPVAEIAGPVDSGGVG
jgi:RNA polymerase sigma factor (sigma-70 family)